MRVLIMSILYSQNLYDICKINCFAYIPSAESDRKYMTCFSGCSMNDLRKSLIEGFF